MLTAHDDFTSVLVRRGIVSVKQVDDARQLAARDGLSVEKAIVLLGYATSWQVIQALAELHGLSCIEPSLVDVASEIIELVPESVARENVVFPLGQRDGVLFVAVSERDLDVIQKLHFILNREVQIVLATREDIAAAIDRHYGGTDVEMVDSGLAGFTDTAIAFGDSEDLTLTRNDRARGGPIVTEALKAFAEEHDPATLEEEEDSVDCMLSLDDEAVVPGARLSRGLLGRGTSFGPLLQRHATVRYFYRMNPLRMAPLLVVLSKKTIEEVVKKHVAQARSANFEVALDSVVEVEPILPGCTCYPPQEQVAIRREEVTARFHIVPMVLGEVMHARVVIRQDGHVLAEVPLQIRVVKQTLALVMGALSFALPVGLMVLKHFGLDFESQKAAGFGVYADALGWLVRYMSPEAFTGILLLFTAILYFWFKPRQRDVFWDVQPAPRQGTVTPTKIAAPPAEPATAPGIEHQETLFQSAERRYAGKDYQSAFKLYECGLLLGPASLQMYHHAALAAHHTGDTRRALEILEQATKQTPESAIKGAIWYNMGCFATRLGRLADAVRYLNQAADAGYDDPREFRDDPELAPLRWRSDFKRLLGSLKR